VVFKSEKSCVFFEVGAEDKVEFEHRPSIMLDSKPQISTFKWCQLLIFRTEYLDDDKL
jgi:hypothetical protein